MIAMLQNPASQVPRAMPFFCPLCPTTFPTRKLLLEHLRSDPELEHKTFRFGAAESSQYPQLRQQGVLACPRGCGAFFNGGDHCVSQPLELRMVEGPFTASALSQILLGKRARCSPPESGEGTSSTTL